MLWSIAETLKRRSTSINVARLEQQIPGVADTGLNQKNI